MLANQHLRFNIGTEACFSLEIDLDRPTVDQVVLYAPGKYSFLKSNVEIGSKTKCKYREKDSWCVCVCVYVRVRVRVRERETVKLLS